MTTKRQIKDARAPEVIQHLKVLAKRHSKRLVVQDYLDYRLKHSPSLPALTTVYRIFGSWGEALDAAGIEHEKNTELSRTSDEALIRALQSVAKKLDTKVLSSHAYDEYRKAYDHSLPSSSVIRKWLGRWQEAVNKAGLETTERSTPRKPTLGETIQAIRQAKEMTEGMLTPRAYAEIYANLSDADKKVWPEPSHIFSVFPSWDAALQASDVEQSDALDPEALWTAEEARRIANQCGVIVGTPLTEASYKSITQQVSRPMPSWKVLKRLLAA